VQAGGNNIFSGTNTFTAANTFKTLNNIRFADQFPGADGGAQINAAIVDLGGKGTIYYMCSPGATITVSTDPFSGRTGADRIHLILGACTFNTSVTWNPPENTWIDGQGERATTVLANASVFTIQFTSGSGGGQYIRLSHMTIDGNKANFAGSGGVKIVGFGQPAVLDNLIVQNAGTLGGVLWDGNAGVSSNNNVGGALYNVWCVGSAAGVVGGAGAGDCITIDNMSDTTLNHVLVEFAPNGLVIKNSQTTTSAGRVSVTGFHAEGITGNMIDLQANGHGFNLRSATIGGGGASSIGVKIAATADSYSIQDAEISTGAGLLAQFQVAGTNFTSSQTRIFRFTQNTLETSNGLAFWQGLTSPFDASANIVVRSAATNQIILADSSGNPLIVGQGNKWISTAFNTNTNCQLGGAAGTTSPAACGSASAGMIAIPASQTSYTVNTSTVTANSEIFLMQMTDNSGLPSSPTCNSGAITPIQSARVAGTSFTFTLTSVASVTCFKYWIIN
jgi:hypothetical protein